MQDNEFTFSRSGGSSGRSFFFLLLFIIFHVLWKDQPALVIENFLPFFPPSLFPSLPLFHSLFKVTASPLTHRSVPF